MSWQIDRGEKIFDSEEEAEAYCKCMMQYGVVCGYRQSPKNPTYKWVIGSDFGLLKLDKDK